MCICSSVKVHSLTLNLLLFSFPVGQRGWGLGQWKSEMGWEEREKNNANKTKRKCCLLHTPIETKPYPAELFVSCCYEMRAFAITQRLSSTWPTEKSPTPQNLQKVKKKMQQNLFWFEDWVKQSQKDEIREVGVSLLRGVWGINQAETGLWQHIPTRQGSESWFIGGGGSAAGSGKIAPATQTWSSNTLLDTFIFLSLSFGQE